ncbi:MAG: HAMP domain-containing histidine kinase [Defluviitaleaceae bacterium]|nr:HAMP domain-containing histidine kinase [Defluviitaleaceae bacterium]
MENLHETKNCKMTIALAHEIKNPAAVALAHVNLLRLELGEEKHLNQIERALNNICGIVREMLLDTKIREELYEVDLSKIFNEILQTYRAAWPEILFLFDDCEKNFFCFGCETSLRMIFSNIIKNAVEAIEFGGENGTIKIFAHTENDFLHVKISDNAAFSSREPREKTHGNGLGLAICRSLANSIGAEFFADGSAVTVRLRTFCPIGA